MPDQPQRNFRSAIQAERCAITAELALKRESDTADIQAQADQLRPWVDGLQISDSPRAWTQMSALAAARLLLDCGVDPIPILTCRDRNRIALTGDLLGLRALGVRSLMLTRGHRVPKKHPLQASTVFDLSGRELIKLAAELNEDETGKSGERFFIGTGARAFRPKAAWRADSLRDRAVAGAEFLQTQLCFNLDLLREYMSRLVELQITWSYSLVISLTPLPSAKTATWVKQVMSDSKIPDEVIERLEQAEDPRAEGIAICAESMQAVAAIPGVSGIHLMSMGDAAAIAEAIERSGLRRG